MSARDIFTDIDPMSDAFSEELDTLPTDSLNILARRYREDSDGHNEALDSPGVHRLFLSDGPVLYAYRQHVVMMTQALKGVDRARAEGADMEDAYVGALNDIAWWASTLWASMLEELAAGGYFDSDM